MVDAHATRIAELETALQTVTAERDAARDEARRLFMRLFYEHSNTHGGARQAANRAAYMADELFEAFPIAGPMAQARDKSIQVGHLTETGRLAPPEAPA